MNLTDSSFTNSEDGSVVIKGLFQVQKLISAPKINVDRIDETLLNSFDQKLLKISVENSGSVSEDEDGVNT